MDLIQNGAPVFLQDQTPDFIKYNMERYGQDWAKATLYQWTQNVQKALNVSLPEDFYEEMVGQMIRAAREQLRWISFLRGRGLTQTGGNLGVTISKWPTLGDFGDAVQTMSPDVDVEDWRRVPGISFVPIPVTHMNFRIDLREQLGWEREGISIDTTYGEQAMRAVAEKLEVTAITETDTVVTVNSTQTSAPGLTKLGNRLTGSINAVWTDVANRNIIGDSDSDINSMKETLSNNNFNGPYMLGVPGNWSHILSEDYDTAGSGRTIDDRISEDDDIDEVLVLDKLPDSELVMVQATSNVVDLRITEDVQVVNWELSPFSTQFKAFAAMVQRSKSDPDAAASGIAHFT